MTVVAPLSISHNPSQRLSPEGHYLIVFLIMLNERLALPFICTMRVRIGK